MYFSPLRPFLGCLTAVLALASSTHAELELATTAVRPAGSTSGDGSCPATAVDPSGAAYGAARVPAASPPDVPAPAEEQAHGSWWFSLRSGAGHLEPDDARGLDAEAGWLLAFSGGYVAGAHWLLGLELGGIGFESGNVWDPSEGRALGNAFLVAEYHPALETGWFGQAAGGWTRYDDNDPQGAIHEGDGWAVRVGPGYEWQLAGRNHLSVLVTYEHGSIAADGGGDWSYDSIAASLGWSWR
jgi:hypothetical protein